MDARDVMTREVLSVGADTPARQIAKLLMQRGVSAAPVVDAQGVPIGMVSEGDLLRSFQPEGRERRDWWLEMLAEGTSLSPEFVLHTLSADPPAAQLMSAPVVSVQESTPVDEIARLLEIHRIKRVPVLRDGTMVGIVSRADLLRALAQSPQPGHGGLLQRLAGIGAKPTAPAPAPAAAATAFSADGFRTLVEHHDASRDEQQRQAEQIAAQHSKEEVDGLLEHHVDDTLWQDLLRRARAAAAEGQHEFLLLRFPSALCGDGGRAINAPEPEWPLSLRGEAAEMFRRWESELRPLGFGMAARMLDFPGGFPGHAGLFLTWGG
jgi:CBS-domain-containing membrane protein